MKTAIVMDWLVLYAGAERVIEQMIACFPEADLFAVVDFLPSEQRSFLQGKSVTTSFIQHLPWAKTYYRHYLPLMPLAIEQWDLSAYDLILSSSHAVAKGVITGPNQLHISYIHSPMRYAWDLQGQYLQESKLTRGLRSWLTRYLLHRMRLWDYASSARVDHFLCNSSYIAKRIQKVYRREATVIYPPVNVSQASPCVKPKGDFYVTASRLVPYKKIPLIAEAFKAMPGKRLVIIGDGPDMQRVRSVIASNVDVLGYQPDHMLKEYLSSAKAFVFAAIEDFGITLVEALSVGTPVIAFGRGGALEIVTDISQGQDATGVLYSEQSVEGIIDAVERFEKASIDSIACINKAKQFGIEQFRQQFRSYVENVI